jgi:hypothetical protein
MKQVSKRGLRIKMLALVLVLGIAAAAVARPAPAQAHCDSINGPVVNAARASLDSGEVRHVLAYVQPEHEAELTTAFNQALSVRALGGQAQEMADMYFFETAVRLHRAGEGAAYTGLDFETDHGRALEAAGEALSGGSLDGVSALLDGALREGLAHRWEAVQEARSKEAAEGTLEAARERAEAELLFEKYVYGLYGAATGEALHGEGGGQQNGHATGHADAAGAATSAAPAAEPALAASAYGPGDLQYED